uniref:Uncharacterized protein n=1 Tax=Anguilla anguilla TaxID=7936 RepID=A0A0E9XE28_ANGAN
MLCLCGWLSFLRPLQIQSHCLTRGTLQTRSIVSGSIHLEWFTFANDLYLLFRQTLHMSCNLLAWDGAEFHMFSVIYLFLSL